MHPNVDRLLCSIAVLVLLAGSASGGVLLDDGDGIGIDPALKSGKQEFGPTILITVPQTDIGTLSSFVEWAVYAPGAFGTSAALGLPVAADPSGGTEYVYAYEIFNAATASKAISSFSVGLYLDAITSVNNKGWLVITDGNSITPSKVEFIPVLSSIDDAQNVKWTFGSPNTTIPLGKHSDYLLFTSPFGPTEKISSVVAIGGLRNRLLPTPIPEPSTVLLGLIGGLSLLAVAGYRRRRRV